MARIVLVLSALLVTIALSATEQPVADSEPMARISLVGNFRGVEETDVEVGGKKVRAVPFQLAKQTPIVGTVSTANIAWLRAEAVVKPVHEEALKAKDKYFKDRFKAIGDEKDEEKRLTLSFEYAEERINPPPFVLLEGEVVGVVTREFELLDKKYPLLQAIIAGKARVLNAEEREKWRSTGGVVVEGTVVTGEFVVGKETFTLGVKNGKLPIVLTGDVAKKPHKLTGTIRVTGELRVEKERLLLKAETLEVVKK